MVTLRLPLNGKSLDQKEYSREKSVRQVESLLA